MFECLIMPPLVWCCGADFSVKWNFELFYTTPVLYMIQQPLVACGYILDSSTSMSCAFQNAVD